MFQQFWIDLLTNTKSSNGHIVANCPICNESKGHFYGNIQTGLWDCKKCQATGNAWTFLRDYHGMESRQITQHFGKYGIRQNEQIENQSIPKPKLFDKKAIEYFCSKLTDEKLSEFALERGLSIETLKKHSLGINDAGEFTLPIIDELGHIRNILRKKIGSDTISSKGGEGLLFGLEDLMFETNEIFVVEGAWSAMALKERGYKAVGTCGAGLLKNEQVAFFKNKEVFFVPDNDNSSKIGFEKINQKLKAIAKHIYVINLPVPEKKDVRDFFKTGGTVEQFEELIKQVRLSRLSNFPLPLPEFLKKDIPPVEFYVMDIIQKKGKGMISAAPNVGKSIFVQNMALDLVCGSANFINKFDISPAKVLYLDLEMGESALKERFQKMCNSRTGSIENLYLKYIPMLNLLNKDSKELIEGWLNELKVDVLMLDPLGNAWAGDESKQESVGQLTSYLNTLIEKFGISILVVHHWRKSTKDFKSGGQMAAGSYKWDAWLDNHVTLEGIPSNITVSFHKHRNRAKSNPFMVKLNTDTLNFDFLGDFQTKYTIETLQSLFDSFDAEKVPIPDLIKRSKEQLGPAETTLRKLIKTCKEFKIEINLKLEK